MRSAIPVLNGFGSARELWPNVKAKSTARSRQRLPLPPKNHPTKPGAQGRIRTDTRPPYHGLHQVNIKNFRRGRGGSKPNQWPRKCDHPTSETTWRARDEARLRGVPKCESPEIADAM